MDAVTIISRKPPYGLINAAEAVRHALGAGDDFKAILLLIDGGIFLAKRAQDIGKTGFSNLEESLGLVEDIEIFVDRDSMISRELKEEDLIEGVKVIGKDDIRNIIKKSHSTMIF
ncbi:MAG: DsrE family protein [Nitrospirota bacterium]|jgi:sulfur relay (sulfurtransferase) DsrF/TusC family protein